MRLIATIVFSAAVIACAAFASGQTTAGPSGTPGDGIPDVYYFPSGGSVNTTIGTIERPGGVLTVDTDGADMVEISISGPDVSADIDCDDYLCPANLLPDFNPPFFLAQYDINYIDQATQWSRIQSGPLPGFIGVVCENPPGSPDDSHCQATLPYPLLGLANYGMGLSDLDFPRQFSPPGSSESYSVLMRSNDGAEYLTNVTVLPEPHYSLVFLTVAFAVLSRQAAILRPVNLAHAKE